MQIEMVIPSDKLWNEVEEYALNCSWRAGEFKAEFSEEIIINIL